MSVPSTEDEGLAIWRRLDMPGHEAVRIYDDDEGWYLDGCAIFLYEDRPCRLEYLIECDPDWRTTFVTVDGFVGEGIVAIEIERDDSGVWFMDGVEVPETEGCVDIDLNFSPATNLLPIKRLAVGIGDATDVRAAWLRFPSFSLEPLDQVYTRSGEFVYNYRSSSGFETDITVDRYGLTVEYPKLWVRER